MRRRPDQPDDAALHVRQKNVLLRLIEPVNLIDEQDGGLPRILQAIGRQRQDPSHFRHVRFNAAQPFEFIPRAGGNDLSEGSFARAWGAVEDERLDPVSLYGPAQELARTQDVRLAHKVIEAARAHAGGQRSLRGGLGRLRGGSGDPNFRR